MRSLSLVLLTLWLSLTALAADGPKGQVGTIYLLPMASGFDQYLANHLTRKGYSVVTDSKRATVVFTDKLGEEFERQMKGLKDKRVAEEKARLKAIEDAKKAEEAKANKKAEDEMTEKEKKDAKLSARERAQAEAVEEANRLNAEQKNATPVSTFSRGRGNVYLVDIASEQVIWSNFDRPKNSRPDTLDEKAKRVVSVLEKVYGPAQP